MVKVISKKKTRGLFSGKIIFIVFSFILGLGLSSSYMNGGPSWSLGSQISKNMIAFRTR